jgi:predicted transcriptional regulator/transcriptional regulator with XRE-family HTH domain
MAKPTLVGNKVRLLRRQSKVTQVEMAARLGISPSYLNLIEHNQRTLTLPLLLKLGELFEIDLQSFSGNEEAQLLADLTEVFGDPVFRGHDVGREELNEVVATVPSLAAAVLGLYRAYRHAREDVLGLTVRLSGNPFLEASSHQLLTLLTSIRTYSEILRDNVDLAATQRQRFVNVLVKESEKLTDQVNELFEFFGAEGMQPPDHAESPAEEVTDYLHAQNNYFQDLEAAAAALRQEIGLAPDSAFESLSARLKSAHGVTVAIEPCGEGAAERRRFDAETGRLHLSEVLPPASRTFQVARQFGLSLCRPAIEARVQEAHLRGEAARALAREVLGNYFAGALLMPYGPFMTAARAMRHDIELLQLRFGTSFEQVCHRLCSLHRPGEEGVPFHFLRVDIAGNIVKRFSASGLRIPRFGGACPRWNVHAAFMNPGRIDTQLAQLPDGSSYLFVARAQSRPGPGFRAPKSHHAILIGCETSFAEQLVYADGLDPGVPGAATPVGTHCRQCERADCAQRAFASLLY